MTFILRKNRAKTRITVEIEGLGANKLPKVFDENMVGHAMKAVAVKKRQSLPKGGTLKLVNAIPPARGLGSSSGSPRRRYPHR